MRVPEQDIDQIAVSKKAELAFASRPEDKFTADLERIEPAAVADKEGNAFLIRAKLDRTAAWLRPGMSGVGKIEAGRRSLLWIGTHRLVEFLRLKFWW